MTVLAFDFGLRRIGVAVGQTISRTATALETLNASDARAVSVRIGELIAEWQPQRLLVGLPRRDNAISEMERPIRRFARKLSDSGLPVELVDESLSSLEARERMRAARQGGARKRARKSDVDAEAARVIAERWLMSQHTEVHSAGDEAIDESE